MPAGFTNQLLSRLVFFLAVCPDTANRADMHAVSLGFKAKRIIQAPEFNKSTALTIIAVVTILKKLYSDRSLPMLTSKLDLQIVIRSNVHFGVS